ncbi:MAG: LamG domain-containing protein, partial [Candidatus Aureabacteria bacterium]|nr:LamG domain-containing protein [Candidatus Auribacterota bacterium]
YFYFHGSTPIEITGPDVLSTDTWHHIAVTWDSTNAYMYVNGVQKGTDAHTFSLLVGPGTTYIGKQISGNYFNGKIDELGVWNRSLSSTEITQLYSSGSGLAIYASPEPTATVWGEEVPPTPTATGTPTHTPTITPTPPPTPTKGLNSPGAPSAGSGMYTFSEIYDYLNSGTVAPALSPFRGPSAGPSSTMKTTKQIYDDIKAKFDECEATAADVEQGKTFFCTKPESWGVRTGTR